jgi:hypothetical protein
VPSQFNTLVQGLSISTITPQQILAAGKPIFLDIRTSSDINSINTLIQSYARIHAPTYGQPIPGSGLVSSLVGAGTILLPVKAEIRKLMACSITNAGAAPVVGTLTIGGVGIVALAADPSATAVVTLPAGIFFSANLALAVSIDSGTPGDLTTSIASILVVQ